MADHLRVVGHVGFLLAVQNVATKEPVILSQSIQSELHRLQLHPVNLHVVSEIDGSIVLQGSLLRSWQVPQNINGHWFLKVLMGLPDLAGPEATMDAFYEAYTAEGAGNV